MTDQQGQPIAGAQVDVNGKRTTSGADGKFELPMSGEGTFILTITHRQYADLTHVSREPLVGQTWRLTRAQVEMVDPTGPIAIEDQREELGPKGLAGAAFELDADSLVDDAGRPPAGQVRAAIATLDVSNGESPGDWAVRSDDGKQDGYLVSYGAVFIQFSDPGGRIHYQLKPGVSGRLNLPVLPSMRQFAAANPRIPFWYFDARDAYWKRAGDSSFDAGAQAYTGKVNHLSTINTDIAKFDDAACLRIDRDSSVAAGLRLRIRYHSGGTPFGQTPTFVMNDPSNAAYRLPANTNVLIELLNASDVPYGDLIVEDPIGTAVVNTVVNTGPEIPSGHTLWPPPPFTDCKPILVRRALTQVEIRVNEVTPTVAAEDNPSDDYLTWAPTFAVARVVTPGAATTVVLTNDAPGVGGDVRFAAHVNPWPANTTATATTVTLALPADGSWVPFVVAGRFGSPSVNDKDTIIQAHQNTATGPVLGTKALMVRVRKNANNLQVSERDRFLFAWRSFRNKLGDNYVQFQELHRLATTAGDEAHMQPAFLSWHRAMLLHVERELQKIDPSVALHYWNWDAASPNVFHPNFIGANGASGFTAEPVFATSNPLNGWDTDLPFSGGELRRSTTDHTADPAGAMKPLDHPVDDSLVAWNDYGPTSSSVFAVNSFSDDQEKNAHNPSHGWPCAGGNLTAPIRSAADPLFYLLHSQVDREWAYWQQKKNRHGQASGGVLTFPAPAHYDNNGAWNSAGNVADPNFRQKGSFLDDGLWPWDGTTGGTAGTAETRPVNQATAAGTTCQPCSVSLTACCENVPASTPLVPSAAFPASVRKNLWPVTATVPHNAHMIDYLGRFRPQDGLGFCYDDVPY